MRFRRLGFVAIVIAAAIGACGGTSVSELLPLSINDGGSPNVDAGGSNDSSVAQDVSAKPDAAQGTDASPTKDAAPDVNVSKPIPLDCPPGGKTCDLRYEFCCRTFDTYDCRAQQQQCGGLRIPCTQQSDCEYRLPGQDRVCCGTIDNQSRVYTIQCSKREECVNDNGYVVLCNPTDADPCPIEGTCTKSTMTLPGFNLCL